jgi:hypothetical protein
MIQVLQGVKVTPKGSKNRFLSDAKWKQQSYAFGGWIYDVSTELNFSTSPTEIQMHVALETSSFSQSAAFFDINQGDLNCSADIGGASNERTFDIDLDGLVFSDFLLYSYDISIDAGQKILHVVFKDHSLILDKIYVGLFRKEGFTFPHFASSIIQMPMRCQTCQYDSSVVSGTGVVSRDIGYASYAGMNGKVYDGFSNVYYGDGNVYDSWNKLIKFSNNQGASPGAFGTFDLNGGYLILGSESATTERCNSSPDVTYSFIELLASLKSNGLAFKGAFPSGYADSDSLYRKNYNGPLRNVLENWCSDLGYTFYCSGKTFIGVNLKNPIDISNLTGIADPTSTLGQGFQINYGGNTNGTAILSMNSKVSLDGTFKQSVVVENDYPIQEKQTSKTVKKYIGITPLHPISLNEINQAQISDINVYGTPFYRSAYDTDCFDKQFTAGGPATIENSAWYLNFARLDGRSYGDVDAAIALTNYNSSLRDMFVAQRALRNVSYGANTVLRYQNGEPVTDANGVILYDSLANPYCVANFNALGMFPVLEITDPQFKTDILSDNITNAEKDGLSNLNIDQQYYRVFLGYYFPDYKEDIINWEKAAADSMYKYGAVTRGTLTTFPFVSGNILDDISPTVGFYGQNGLVYTRLENSFDPSTDRYQDVKTFPNPDVFIGSGYVKSLSQGTYYRNNSSYTSFIPPGYSDYPGRVPTGLWIASLDNPWGTTQEDFNRQLTMQLTDVCAQNYSISQSAQEQLTQTDRQNQDWRLEDFLPIANPDLEKVDDLIRTLVYDGYNIDTFPDEVVTTYVDIHRIQKKHCKKLHVLIIPDTITHPNIYAQFNARPINKINPIALKTYKQRLYETDLKKFTTETPSICSLSLLDEMCRNLLTGAQGSNYTLQGFNFPSTQANGCVLLENKNNPFFYGFQNDTLYRPNSRSLDIYIQKNPNKEFSMPTDVNGDIYFSDLDGTVVLQDGSLNTSIIYPVQPNSQQYAGFGYGSQANYSGVLSTTILEEYRIPKLTNIYGSPVNTTGNNTIKQKMIHTPVDDTLQPQLDPNSNKATPYITVISGGGYSNIVTTPQQYYNLISGINNYNLDVPTKTIDLSLAGSPRFFPSAFLPYLTPSNGLISIKLSVGENGVKTDMTFSDRPKQLPTEEAILNKIGPRIKGVYN